MTELLDGLWRASLWLAVGVVLLAVLRPLLVRLGALGWPTAAGGCCRCCWWP
jgi:hypothetical protein